MQECAGLWLLGPMHVLLSLWASDFCLAGAFCFGNASSFLQSKPDWWWYAGSFKGNRMADLPGNRGHLTSNGAYTLYSTCNAAALGSAPVGLNFPGESSILLELT